MSNVNGVTTTDVVIYIKAGDKSILGQTNKDLWIVQSLDYIHEYARGMRVTAKLRSITNPDKKPFVTDVTNVFKVSKILNEGYKLRDIVSKAAYTAYMGRNNTAEAVKSAKETRKERAQKLRQDDRLDASKYYQDPRQSGKTTKAKMAKEQFYKQEYDDIWVDETKSQKFREEIIKQIEKDKKSIKIPTQGKISVKEINMNDKVKRTVNANVDAAKTAASITAGKTLNKIVADKVTPQLPLMVRGYAGTPLGTVVIANVADFAVKQFMPHNEKANIATDAMMQAAMVELLGSFDLEKIVNEVVSSVELPVVAE